MNTTVLSDIDIADDVTTTITTSLPAGSIYSVPAGAFNSTAVRPDIQFKTGSSITLKSEGGESAEFNAAFINDLKILLEVINDLPDQHPLGELKHDMRMRRAFKRLGG